MDAAGDQPADGPGQWASEDDALRASEARLRELNIELERRVIERAQARTLTWQLSPDLLGALNSEGYFVTSNPAWGTVLGWSEAEVATMSIFELLHPDDLEHTRAGFELTQIGQPALRFVNRYRCKNGDYRWISWVGIPEDGFVYCTGRDVTAERAAEVELAAAQEALRQSQKMEAIGQLTGGIAHDFNNLLTGILGSLDLVRRRWRRTGPTTSRASWTLRRSPRCAPLRSPIGCWRSPAVSRSTPGPTTSTACSRAWRTCCGARSARTISLHSNLAADLWTAFADANQLESALLNLAINARDAMPDGGQLTIETANVRLDEAGASQQPDAQPGDYVVVRVSDTGVGMPPDVAARAVDPFFTTKPVGEGTGLGLSMIDGFAKQSRGHLRIQSEVGRGTTVELYLPRALQDAVVLEAPALQTPRGQGETVLVVEDDTGGAADHQRGAQGARLRRPGGLRRPPGHSHSTVRIGGST